MGQEVYPFLGDATPDNFDPWSRRNIMLADGDRPAPRHEGNLEAIAALYESGQVFHGQIDIPVLDFRHWLEPRSEEHTSELQSRGHLVCRLLLEKKKSERYV